MERVGWLSFMLRCVRPLRSSKRPRMLTKKCSFPYGGAQIQSIQDAIRQFDQNVSRVSDMHSRTLNSMDDSQQNHAVLDDLVGETRSLSNQLRNRIQTLAKQPTPPGQDARIRQNQVRIILFPSCCAFL